MDLKIDCKDRMVELIDRALHADNLPIEVKMKLKTISDKEKDLHQLRTVVDLVSQEIRWLETASGSDPRELSRLLELRKTLLKNNNKVWQKNSDRLNQDLEVVNNKIAEIDTRITKWRNDIGFFREALEYLKMELEVEKLK